MRIYTEIRIDMSTLEVIDSVYTEYDGPVAYCGGGSKGGGGDAVDKEYNAGMLALSQEQQSWANEMFNMFKYGTTYDPTSVDIATGKTLGEINGFDASKISEMDLMSQYFQAQSELMPYEQKATQAGLTLEQKTAEAKAGLVPLQTAAEKAGIESGLQVLPYQTQAAISGLGLQTAQSESGMRLQPLAEETARLGLEQQKQVLTERSPVISQLYKDALSGVDVNKRVAEARAGVQQAYAGAETGMTRNLARYGMAPNESDFRNLEIAKAKGMTGAEGDVYRQADTENFQRRVTALGLNP